MQISPLPRATIQDNDRGVWTRESGRLAGHVAPTLITLRLRGNFVPAGIRELRNRGTVLTLETQRQAAGVVPPFLLSNSGPRSKVDPRGFGGDDRNFLQRLGTKCGNASMKRKKKLFRISVNESSRFRKVETRSWWNYNVQISSSNRTICP